MSRFRLFLLGLLAVLAVGAVASASASAESCTGGTEKVFCLSPGNTPLNGESVLGLGGLSLLAGTITGAPAKFDCSDVHFKGTLGLLGASTDLFLFLNCKLEKPAGCKLSAAQEKEIDVKVNGQQTSATTETFTGAGASEEFVKLNVEKNGAESCAATGEFTVAGSQLAKTPTGAEGKVEQEVTTVKTESMLTLGGNAASFSSKGEVHLGGANKGSTWLVMEGM